MDSSRSLLPVVLTTVPECRAWCDGVRRAGGSLGVVPTMGALHAGHLSLMRVAAGMTDRVLVTIFVNPTQFGPGEDLAKYPRDKQGDLVKCSTEGVAAVFLPTEAEMYPPGDKTRVVVSGLSEVLCGASRPNHFTGVATIVTKLFAIVGRCTAVFGKKDYQQLQVVRRMVTDLMLPVTVVEAPIMRDTDGLALSSRNAYLSSEARQRALALVAGLSEAVRAYDAGERRVGRLVELARAPALANQLDIDYVTLSDPDTLVPFDDDTLLNGAALLAMAAFVDKTRLIDNVVLGRDPDPLAGAGS